jgi:hypothetical protein
VAGNGEVAGDADANAAGNGEVAGDAEAASSGQTGAWHSFVFGALFSRMQVVRFDAADPSEDFK